MIDWTDEIVARLGNEPDARIADDLGVSRETVRQQRGKRDIAKFVVDKTLPDEVLERLGTVADPVLAREYDVPVSRVAAERRKRGLKVPSPPTKAQGLLADIDWRTDTDAEVGERFGLAEITVMRYRLKMDIPSARDRGRRSSRRALPESFEHEGVDFTPWLQVFARLSNGQLSEQIGVSEHKVAVVREMLGVPVYHRMPKDPDGLNWADIICWFGKKSDRDIANQFGISSSRVCTLRKKCGIGAFAHRNDSKKTRFLRMIGNGVDQNDARDACGLSASYAINVLKEAGIKCY